ncbi:MAG: tripartite tricarboxylate transporter substrate binding protein [Burkholderiaceae bacterium]
MASIKLKHLLGAALAAATLLVTAQTFPERDLSGIIMWGAGGATDVVARAIAPPAEEALGKKIVLQNKAGGVGAIATNFVNQQPADGYTLLFGAENPQLHPVLGISTLDYSKFFPVNVIARGVVLVVAANDKPWKSMKDLLADVQSNPGKTKMGSTGAGGLPFTVSSMIKTVAPLPVIAVPFDGEGPGVTALQGGHIDFMIVGAGAVSEQIKAGRLKALAVVDTSARDGVEPITDALPGMAKYLPWGPFYGVFLKQDAPESARAKLVSAFKIAADNAQFRALMTSRGNVMMNISGKEAEAFLKKWQSTTSWTYQEVGAAKKDPAELGIAKP